MNRPRAAAIVLAAVAVVVTGTLAWFLWSRERAAGGVAGARDSCSAKSGRADAAADADTARGSTKRTAAAA